MSSSAGLSRRRAQATSTEPSLSSPAVSAPGQQQQQQSSGSSAAISGSSSGSNSNARGKGPKTGVTPPSHKIAFDARDMENGEEKVMPKLTLMEEVLLLGLKDKQVESLPLLSVHASRSRSRLPKKKHRWDYSPARSTVLQLAHGISMAEIVNPWSCSEVRDAV